MKIKLRLAIPVAAVVLALVGAFVWPGFLITTDSSSTPAASSTVADGRGETARDAGQVERDKDDFEQIKNDLFYRCPANDYAKGVQWPNVKMLIPCGTDIVEIVKVSDDAADVPRVVDYAGGGGDNVVIAKHGVANVDDFEAAVWTVVWTVGQHSTFLQMYVQYFCGADGNQRCWEPVAKNPHPDTGEFSYDLAAGVISIGLVFTDGTPGTPVPFEWWRTSNLRR